MAGSRRLTPEALALFYHEFGIEHHKDSLQDWADTEGAAFLSDLFAELDCGDPCLHRRRESHMKLVSCMAGTVMLLNFPFREGWCDENREGTSRRHRPSGHFNKVLLFRSSFSLERLLRDS